MYGVAVVWFVMEPWPNVIGRQALDEVMEPWTMDRIRARASSRSR